MDRGGDVFYDAGSDAIIYGKNMKTSTMGEKYIHVAYKPDASLSGARYPDFSKYTAERVNVGKITGGTKDYGPAWKALSEQKGAAYVKDKYGISPSSNGNYPNRGAKPSTRTWHHHQDLSHMELIDRDIHDLFLHQGGSSLVKKN